MYDSSVVRSRCKNEIFFGADSSKVSGMYPWCQIILSEYDRLKALDPLEKMLELS